MGKNCSMEEEVILRQREREEREKRERRERERTVGGVREACQCIIII